MTDPFAVRFAAAREKYGPLVLGADPHGALLERWGLSDDADGLRRFADVVLKAADGATGIIKPQSAFFERHGWRGIRELARLMENARSRGILVVLDVKRGDVGSTNDAYADAYLGPTAPLEADAITVSPYLGLEAMGAYTTRAQQAGACVFVVTRSSNPEGRTIQFSRTPRGISVEHHLLATIGELNQKLAPGSIVPGSIVPGSNGPGTIGPVGAVVGADPALPPLNLAAANALFLVPGVGAQGTTPEDVARVFADCPGRVLPSASRSLLSAGPGPGALRDAVTRLNAEFRTALPG